jgi:uncharacterized protein (TIGR00255 family)
MQSMTGYGRGEAAAGGLRITVELRSVNHRFADVQARLPRELLALEPDVLRAVKERVARGRIDVFVRRDAEAGGAGVDTAAVGSVLMALRAAAAAVPAGIAVLPEIRLGELLLAPSIMDGAVATDPEAERPLVLSALHSAIGALVASRMSEGERLRADLAHHLDRIAEEVDAASILCATYPDAVRSRLADRLRDLLGASFDPTRIAQEAALLAERADTAEEIVRLRGHVEATRKLLASRESVGRKLEFLVQELHREANTIGSKCDDARVTARVIELKSIIEKLREQCANIE